MMAKCKLLVSYIYAFLYFFIAIVCLVQPIVGSNLKINDSNFETDLETQPPPLKDAQEFCTEGDYCIRKCCPFGQFFDSNFFDCLLVEESESNVKEWKPRENWENSLNIVTGFPSPPGNDTVCALFEEKTFEIQSNGQLRLYDRREIFSHEMFCIENTLNAKNETEEMSLTCVKPIMLSDFEETARTVQLIGHYISLVCIILIFFLYGIAPKSNSLQTKCIISYCVALLATFVVSIMLQSHGLKIFLSEHRNFCISLALILQFFGLSFHCWLNITIYEIYRVISGTIKVRPYNTLEGTNKRFLMYALYACGCPLIVTFITSILQSLPLDNHDFIHPGIAFGRCWFTASTGAIYAYYYGLEAFLIIVDGAFIVGTISLLKWGTLFPFMLCCRKNVNDVKISKLSTNNRKDYLEMFWHQFATIIMYVFIWAINTLSLIYSSWIYWGVANVIVSLQGLFLLLIVIRSRDYFFVKNAHAKLTSTAQTITSNIISSTRKTSTDLSSYFATNTSYNVPKPEEESYKNDQSAI